jgi:hypothetical protein
MKKKTPTWVKKADPEWPADQPSLLAAHELWHDTRHGYWLALFKGDRRHLWVLYTPSFDEIHNQYELPCNNVNGPPITWASYCLNQ